MSRLPREATYGVQLAAQYVRDNLDAGVRCPCCTQYAKRYRRPLNRHMVYALALLNREQRRDASKWIHVPTFLHAVAREGVTVRGGDYAKLVHWGLLVAKPEIRGDGSPRAGYFKVTDKGRAFAEGRLKVPSHVLLFNEQFVGFSGKQISIGEAARNHFNFKELMRG